MQDLVVFQNEDFYQKFISDKNKFKQFKKKHAYAQSKSLKIATPFISINFNRFISFKKELETVYYDFL